MYVQIGTYVIPSDQIETRLLEEGSECELDVYVEIGGDQGIRFHEGEPPLRLYQLSLADKTDTAVDEYHRCCTIMISQYRNLSINQDIV